MTQFKYRAFVPCMVLLLIQLSCGREAKSPNKDDLNSFLRTYSPKEIASIKSSVDTITGEDIREILIDVIGLTLKVGPMKT